MNNLLIENQFYFIFWSYCVFFLLLNGLIAYYITAYIKRKKLFKNLSQESISHDGKKS
jgi:hypothetical protein